MSDTTGTRKTIDLNADLGEGFDSDVALCALVTSANISTGAYTNNFAAVRKTLRVAVANEVCVGMHPGFPDVASFGRVMPSDLDLERLEASLDVQVNQFLEYCEVEGATCCYLKPHGALYHAMVDVPGVGEVIEGLAQQYNLPLLHQRAAALDKRVNVDVYSEGFAERRYLDEHRLVPRSQSNAFIELPAEAARQAVQLADRVDSICIHGDAAQAVEVARTVREQLQAAGYAIQSFVG